MKEFHTKFRTPDVLLVDDIQFIENKVQMQEEFFYTFEALINQGKQIVLTSDRPPKEIKTLEDRLRSRFESGLIADIQPPELETRIAIIKDKAKVVAVPEIVANNVDANLIHEAAIGKIAGEQLTKLMTLGLTEKEAEEAIVNGFLK